MTVELGESSMRDRVRSAVFWRAGSQIAAQAVTWSSTFLVIRLLSPSDYGLFAMTQFVLSLMALMNGYSFTGALVQSGSVDRTRTAQVFGMLIVLNFSLAAAQFLLAPLGALYFREPMVANMLRVQALFHLATPFIIMPQALLSRTIDFRTQARVNLVAAAAAAVVAPSCALLGLGVWTLVAAPATLYFVRAIGLAVVGRWWITPSFRFGGAAATLGFGGTMLLSDLFWFIQIQADVFVGGRVLDVHQLGLYTTALFLTQILVNKFVPALNEVAFPAYARLGDRSEVGPAFVKAIRIVMVVALPFYLGMAATADPIVRTMLGAHWVEAIPLVRLLALAMPLVTLHILFSPVTNALGRPGIAARIAACGAVIMPIAFMIGVRWGATGMAWAWLAAFPLLLAISIRLSLPVIGIGLGPLLRAIRPSLGAALGMVLVVITLDSALPPLLPVARLALLVAAGAASYAVLLLATARTLVTEVLGLVRRAG